MTGDAGSTNPLLERFLAAADAVALERPEVDAEIARELMGEAAVMLHNGLALDDLDEHDTGAAVDGLSRALADPDPASAVRAGAQDALDHPDDLHDPEAVSATYLVAGAMLQL